LISKTKKPECVARKITSETYARAELVLRNSTIDFTSSLGTGIPVMKLRNMDVVAAML
jgi:hypothetical protein